MKKLGIKDRAPALSLSFFSLSIASTARASAALAGEIAKQSYTKLLTHLLQLARVDVA
jgi:hypothetical protein